MLDYIRVGKIANTHGLKGFIKCMPLTDNIERFDELEYVFTENDNIKRTIQEVFYNKGLVYLKFKDINDINEAEKLKNMYITIEKNQLKELPNDSYYIFEIIGLEVFSVEGEYIGVIKDILQTGANDVYVVVNNNNRYLIPAINDVIKEINIEDNKVIIKIIEGLLE